MTTALLVIDPQNDFMDSPQFTGSLAVPGAYADMKLLSEYLDKNPVDAIFITLDTHARYDIAHPEWWQDKSGHCPAPFTVITPHDVAEGTWQATLEGDREYSKFYVEELARKGKYPLCIWPYHCIEGSVGHKVESTFAQAVARWENKTGSRVEYIYKGMNPRTEHYSGLRAEVELDDPLTQLNTRVISLLDSFDKIVVAGEAQSHCVASTTMDLLGNISEPGKVVLLLDCMSSVPGFESAGAQFIATALQSGAQSFVVGKKETLSI